VDAVREEGRKRFKEEAEKRVEALREGLREFKGDVVGKKGGLQAVFEGWGKSTRNPRNSAPLQHTRFGFWQILDILYALDHIKHRLKPALFANNIPLEFAQPFTLCWSGAEFRGFRVDFPQPSC
jgi:hypothetical protein